MINAIGLIFMLNLHAGWLQNSVSVRLWLELSASMFVHPAVHDLDRVRSPSPQVTEQTDQSFHSLNSGLLHSVSVWHVQSGACTSKILSTGSKWRWQVIVCLCASVDDSSVDWNLKVRNENSTLRPNTVCSTLSLIWNFNQSDRDYGI